MESRWINHREWYAHKIWMELLETLAPQQRVIKLFEEKMEEYDRANIQSQEQELLSGGDSE